MFSCIYVEEGIQSHSRTEAILAKYPQVPVVSCKHYKDVFNPGHQQFRVQKQSPALILAQQNGAKVLSTPEGFGIGGHHNYYFSHMMNCVYDCQYCFLQGMYPSANYVLFVNFEEFQTDIAAIASELKEPAYFFSGYDCDSLAMDGLTGFIDSFIPFFAKHPRAILELRTKSTQIRALLKHEPLENCVVAFSFTPEQISQSIEKGVPKLEKRISAIQQLALSGWKVGLRFDPLIYASGFESLYETLVATLFDGLAVAQVHSVSIGPMRFPEKMYKKIVGQHPRAKLLAHPLEKRDGIVSYSKERESQMSSFVKEKLMQYIPSHLLFECHNL